jgi:hypothetical protein
MVKNSSKRAILTKTISELSKAFTKTDKLYILCESSYRPILFESINLLPSIW